MGLAGKDVMLLFGRIFLCACLAIGIVLRIIVPRTDLQSAASALAQPKELVIHDDLPSAMSFRWARPLFSRQSLLKVDVPAVAAQQSEKRTVRIVGILTEADTRVALLDVDGKLRRARPGDAVGVSTIKAIEPRWVTLESGGRTEVLYLEPKTTVK